MASCVDYPPQASKAYSNVIQEVVEEDVHAIRHTGNVINMINNYYFND